MLGRDGLLFVQLQLVPLLRFAMREACIAFQTEERGALDIFGAVGCRVLSCRPRLHRGDVNSVYSVYSV